MTFHGTHETRRARACFQSLSLREAALCAAPKQSSWIAAARFAHLAMTVIRRHALANVSVINCCCAGSHHNRKFRGRRTSRSRLSSERGLEVRQARRRGDRARTTSSSARPSFPARSELQSGSFMAARPATSGHTVFTDYRRETRSLLFVVSLGLGYFDCECLRVGRRRSSRRGADSVASWVFYVHRVKLSLRPLERERRR